MKSSTYGSVGKVPLNKKMTGRFLAQLHPSNFLCIILYVLCAQSLILIDGMTQREVQWINLSCLSNHSYFTIQCLDQVLFELFIVLIFLDQQGTRNIYVADFIKIKVGVDSWLIKTYPVSCQSLFRRLLCICHFQMSASVCKSANCGRWETDHLFSVGGPGGGGGGGGRVGGVG